MSELRKIACYNLTVGELKQLLEQFPDDMNVTSHMGKCWTGTIRLQETTTSDPVTNEVIETTLSIAGDGPAQDIWVD